MSYPQSTQPPHLEFWGGEQNKHPTIQTEILRDLLFYLDCQKFMELDGIYQRVLADIISKVVSTIYHQS